MRMQRKTKFGKGKQRENNKISFSFTLIGNKAVLGIFTQKIKSRTDQNVEQFTAFSIIYSPPTFKQT